MSKADGKIVEAAREVMQDIIAIAETCECDQKAELTTEVKQLNDLLTALERK